MKILSALLLSLTTLLLTVQPTHAVQWSEDLANTFVYYAAAAICPSGISDWTCFECQYVPGFQVTANVVNQVSGVAFYAGHSDTNKTIVISFKGTANAQNGIEDFLYPSTNQLIPYTFDPSGQSHVEDGFWLAYLSVQQDVISAIDYYNTNAAYQDYKVWVTGHSLGAALSLHGAMQAYISSKQATANGLTVYNYGQPRVGDTAFADFYDARIPDTWAQINNSDPVPRLPPRAINQESGFGLPLYQYTRQLHEVWYQEIGSTWVVHSNCVPDAGGEAPDCSDSDLASLGIGLPDAAGFPNHLVYQYHSMLCNQEGTQPFILLTELPSIPNGFLPNPTTAAATTSASGKHAKATKAASTKHP